jgi:hypothetical protein
LLNKDLHRNFSSLKESSFNLQNIFFKNFVKEHHWFWDRRKVINYENYTRYSFVPLKLLFWKSMYLYPESFWYAASRLIKARRRKVYFTKCSNRTLTAAGWTFITPFSSNTNLLVLVHKIF